jgi:hypothetical protein
LELCGPCFGKWRAQVVTPPGVNDWPPSLNTEESAAAWRKATNEWLALACSTRKQA